LISENGMSETPSGQATDAIRHADILIIGGGLSGAMLAAQLLRLPGKRRVLVIEPAPSSVAARPTAPWSWAIPSTATQHA
jgi:2-polyprenyl-6-methoxyphenol hydroxylase-like FAD-dependent oxidoreductase